MRFLTTNTRAQSQSVDKAWLITQRGNKETRSLSDALFRRIHCGSPVHYSCWSREADIHRVLRRQPQNPLRRHRSPGLDMWTWWGLHRGKMRCLCSSLDSPQWTKRWLASPLMGLNVVGGPDGAVIWALDELWVKTQGLRPIIGIF